MNVKNFVLLFSAGNLPKKEKNGITEVFKEEHPEHNFGIDELDKKR